MFAKHPSAIGIAAAGAAGAAVLLSAGSAFAAGTGYTPSQPASATSAGFTTVVASQTFSQSGGSLQGSANGASAKVVVPAGSLAGPTEVVLGAGSSTSVNTGSAGGFVVGFSVSLIDPNTGAKLSGPFTPPITLTITDPSIQPGDHVVVVTGPGQVQSFSGAQVSQGVATVSFTTDPNFAVLTSSASGSTTTAVPGATTVTTGEPFLVEEIAAGALVLTGGAGTVVFARRRRRHA